MNYVSHSQSGSGTFAPPHKKGEHFKKKETSGEGGNYKTPTPADVEAQITKARESAAKGEGNDMKTGEYARFLSQASRWAAKIGYEMHDALAGELAGTRSEGRRVGKE